MLLAELAAEGTVTAFTPTVAGSGAAMLETPMGKAVLRAIDLGYTMRPVGSETATELKNRIAAVYIDAVVPAGKYTTDAAKILNDSTFRATVRNVCPLCGEKSFSLPGTEKPNLQPSDFTTPKPGSIPATGLSMNDILELLKAGMGTYTTLQQQKLAAELMRRQQAGQPVYIPEEVQKGWSTGAIVGVSMGALLLGGLIIYLLSSKKSTKAAPVNTTALVKAR